MPATKRADALNGDHPGPECAAGSERDTQKWRGPRTGQWAVRNDYHDYRAELSYGDLPTIPADCSVQRKHHPDAPHGRPLHARCRVVPRRVADKCELLEPTRRPGSDRDSDDNSPVGILSLQTPTTFALPSRTRLSPARRSRNRASQLRNTSSPRRTPRRRQPTATSTRMAQPSPPSFPATGP